MMRPETNTLREAISLDGIWRCRPDHDGQADWSAGFDSGWPVAVPGSWNEQLAERGLMNFEGPLWYRRTFHVPARAHGQRILLHFGSADYHATVFVNGQRLGESGPLMLPFTIEASDAVTPGDTAELVVRVDARLPEHGPMQNVRQADYAAEGRPKDEYHPAVRFDFFPFGGLNRSVYLCLLPLEGIDDAWIETGYADRQATLALCVNAREGRLRASLNGQPLGEPFAPGEHVRFHPSTNPWSPDDPRLYELVIESLGKNGRPLDRIERRIGFRTLRVDGQRLFLNDRPITLRGFGKHEDTPIAGRGVNLPMLVKDFSLLSWTGANSVRTSHYPYDEAFLDLADERGVLVISECFSVNLDFRRTGEADLEEHKEALAAQFARDGHHASVVAWSLSNEPGYLGEPEYHERSGSYWQKLFAHAKSLDASRPMTVANVQYAGTDDPAFGASDFLTINRYFGWYTEPGQLDRAEARLRETLDELADTHGKPVFVAEFGADAVAGMHATTDQMWTEEYQSGLIRRYWCVIEDHPACIGGHVWNFADFRTAQHGRRAVMNRKGVFTRERNPKRAACTLRELWRGNAHGD